MSDIYTECITKYSFVHFHLLDGYLNPNYGSTIDIANMNIEMMEKLLNEFDNNLSNLIKINLLNISDYDIKIDFEPTKYNIIQVLYNNHATSFVSFIQNEKSNFLFFNSGEGIELHEKYNDKYLPYFGYSFDKTDYINIYNKIKAVINLYNFITNYKYFTRGSFYSSIKKFFENLKILMDNLNEEKKEKINQIDLNNNTFKEFIDICKKIDVINTESEIRKIEISESNANQYACYELDYLKYNNDDKMFNINYYNFINIILDIIFENHKYKSNINIIEKVNFTEDLTNILFPDKLKRNKVTDNIINKIKFYFHNKNIYINSQESGSCVWFSLYWSILFYFIINNKDDNYFRFIEIILNKCVKFIEDYYNNNENFLKIFEYNLDKYFKFCDLCYKFININLLTNNIIEDNNYCNLLFKSENLNWNLIKKNNTLTLQEVLNDIQPIVSSDFDYLKYIGLLIKDFINGVDSNTICLKLFNLYTYIKDNNIVLFKQNFNIDDFEKSLNFNLLKKNKFEYEYLSKLNDSQIFKLDIHLNIYLINLIILYNNKEFLLPKSIINYYYISKILFDINKYEYEIRDLIDFTFFFSNKYDNYKIN